MAMALKCVLICDYFNSLFVVFFPSASVFYTFGTLSFFVVFNCMNCCLLILACTPFDVVILFFKY